MGKQQQPAGRSGEPVRLGDVLAATVEDHTRQLAAIEKDLAALKQAAKGGRRGR